MKSFVLTGSLVLAVLVLAACGGAATPAPQAMPTPIAAAMPSATSPPPSPAPPASPTSAPTATQAAAPTEAPTDAPTDAPPATATNAPTAVALSPEVGHQIWESKPCSTCHGANAEGNIGPSLAGTGLTFDAVLLRVRAGKGPMPAFTTDQISDLEVQQIYTWLESLPPPSPAATATTPPTATAEVARRAPTATSPPVALVQPSPIPPPNYPTGSLNAFWASVNDLKVKTDFTKDLPARQAQDDAGRLAILKQYAGQAVGDGQNALAQGNQSLGEVTNEQVKTDIRNALNAVQQIIDQANQASGQSTFGTAYQNASEMTRLARIEALPWATQAVRDAGLTGTVRVRVTDQAGRPIPNAFVTVLTSRNPVGVQTDANGRATVVNAAAVPALQVKAYGAGLVYHEAHANLAPGSTVETDIALPSANLAGQAPRSAGASITPSSGSGSATVTFRMQATDPQGAQDLAEDQIFALNPTLGMAYVLPAAGNNQYAFQAQLPGLAAGPQTWYFFAVDHECNTSNVIPVRYTVR
jgi:mono/diheme cytochrome c family protein